MTIRSTSTALVLLVVLLLPACSSEGGTTSGAVSSADPLELGPRENLYGYARELTPGDPGDVIAVQVVTGVDVAATVLRVLYHSRSVADEDIAVSGLIVVPRGPAPAAGRTVLSWAHGTTGIADQCAPSKDPTSAGVGLLGPFIDRGMVVVATDYEGLGTPGVHPYLVGESEGRGVLDIARAARALGGRVGASDRVVIWGHSQGGQAALFANQIASTWAPELDVLGTVAGAPPANLTALIEGLSASSNSAFLGMIVVGWSATYSDADPTQVLTPRGIETLATVSSACGGALVAAWDNVRYDELVHADPTKVEPWATLLERNGSGSLASDSPVLIVHGEQDELIPLESSQLLRRQLCGRGQAVDLRTYPGNHVGVIAPSFSDMLDWIDSRVAGEVAPSSCPR